MVIEEGTYVDKAEQVISRLKENKNKGGKVKWITTSKIRNLLAMSADIYNEILSKEEKLSTEVNARIDYLRVRFIYESGRDKDVEKFVNTAEIIQALQEIKGSRKRFILFNHYMEALVAYHRYYGGEDH
ncbi:MAG: type III-A CRISPR-associated protein Csm2 [Bacteroides sp.]|nr:type III-A CRISPR-associated protein Csm2 [Bacteroides sp.]MCM1548740.1 type III-A CRISPR-associated protein Csm2 [Clostridium sp.]